MTTCTAYMQVRYILLPALIVHNHSIDRHLPSESDMCTHMYNTFEMISVCGCVARLMIESSQ